MEAGGVGEFFHFIHGFLRNQDAHFAVESGEFLIRFPQAPGRCPSVATIANVSGFENQEAAV